MTGVLDPRNPTDSVKPDFGSSADTQDPRLVEALEKFLQDVESGHPPDQAEFLARYREIAGPLALCLGGLEALRGPSTIGSTDGTHAGEVLDSAMPLGDFRIVRELGRGGMGVVYEAMQLSLGRRVALKVLPFAATLDPRQLQRFQNEARACACLHHTNIVPVYAVGCERGVHYYAMQFIEGQSLDLVLHTLRQENKSASPMPMPPNGSIIVAPTSPNAKGCPQPANGSNPSARQTTLSSPRQGKEYYRRVAEIIGQAAEALEHAHQRGVVHRDIKPANLMLDGTGKLWITDFGLAQFQSDVRMTLTGDVVGTLRYMSPEQALAKRIVLDHRTDVYSLGATLYELLTLQPPFTGQDRQELLRQIAFDQPMGPRRMNGAIPAELETIALKSIEKDPDERYSSAKKLADDLERFLKNQPVLARQPTLLQCSRKWAQRHWAAVWAATVTSLAIVVIAALATGWTLREREVLEAKWQQEHAEEEAEQLRASIAQNDETERITINALLEAARLEAERKLPEALAAATRAKAAVAVGISNPSLEKRIQSRVRDLKFLTELEDIRSKRFMFYRDWRGDDGKSRYPSMALFKYGSDYLEFDRRFAKAFSDFGIDVDGLPSTAGGQVREQVIAIELVAALDEWSFVVWCVQPFNKSKRKQLLEVAQAAGPHPWRAKWEEVLNSIDYKNWMGSLVDTQLGGGSVGLPRWENETNLVCLQAGNVLTKTLQLSNSLQGHLVFQYEAVRNRKGDALAFLHLGLGLWHMRQPFAARVAFAQCIPDKHTAEALLARISDLPLDVEQMDSPTAVLLSALINCTNEPTDLFRFGNAFKYFQMQGQASEAFARAARCTPDDEKAHLIASNALFGRKPVENEFPAYPPTFRIGKALWSEADLSSAAIFFQRTVACHPDLAVGHCYLGRTLSAMGKTREAVHAYRKALKHKFYPWDIDWVIEAGSHWTREGTKCFLAPREVNGVDFFFVAMAYWQMGDISWARKTYMKGFEWMQDNKSGDPELERFRAEAAAMLEIQPTDLLGVPPGRLKQQATSGGKK